jgi:hypothetical protein
MGQTADAARFLFVARGGMKVEGGAGSGREKWRLQYSDYAVNPNS